MSFIMLLWRRQERMRRWPNCLMLPGRPLALPAAGAGGGAGRFSMPSRLVLVREGLMEPDFAAPGFFPTLIELLRWRRDVRRFRRDALPEDEVLDLLRVAQLAPSVGLSQPWRFMRVKSEAARAAVRENFEHCNAEALGGYRGEDAALYARLKLSGLDDAPVQIAVFCDGGCETGRGLGRRTMPEMAEYSVVAAVHT